MSKPEIKEFMSPEGLEEAVEMDCRFMVTLTQGGKYRVYVRPPGATQWTPSSTCSETMEAARKDLGRRMALLGALMADPKAVVDILLKPLGGLE